MKPCFQVCLAPTMNLPLLKAMVVSIGFLSAIGVINVANAHDEALESGWCSDGQITILAQFTLNPSVLLKFTGDENPVCSQFKSCGQFDDDDYSIGRRTASGMCQSLSEAEMLFRSEGDHETVRPIFHAPATMKNIEINHHAVYQLEQGLEFSCGYCSIPEIEQRPEEVAEPIAEGVEETRER